jgi:hypothetical protein
MRKVAVLCLSSALAPLALAAPAGEVGCRIPASQSGATLGSIGGERDAALFSGYLIKFLPDGRLAVLDPVGQRLLIFARGNNGALDCARPTEKIDVTGAPISAIAQVDGVVYGLDIAGTFSRIFPPQPTPVTGESLRPPELAQQPAVVLAELASSNPLRAGRAVWPGVEGAPGSSHGTGEIGLSPGENRLTSVPNGVILIAGIEHRYGFEWASQSRGTLRIWRAGQPNSVLGLDIEVPSILGAVDILKATRDGYTVSVESIDLTRSGSIRVVDHVLAFSADGVLQIRRVLPVPTPSTKGPWTPMDLPAQRDPLDDDRVFYFYRDKSAVVAVAARLSSARQASASTGAPPPDFAPSDPARDRLLSRAEAFLNASWKTADANLNTAHADWSCRPPYSVASERWAQPIFLRGIRKGVDVYGIPYLWGGKAGWQDFVARVQAGGIAGNVCTKTVAGKAVSVSGAAGIDCSGFISRVWELGGAKRVDLSTSAIASNKFSRPVKLLQNLQPGDALNKAGSHVRLFAGWVRTPFGLRIRSYESTTDSICSGTCMRDLRARAYIGYEPRAYPK